MTPVEPVEPVSPVSPVIPVEPIAPEKVITLDDLLEETKEEPIPMQVEPDIPELEVKVEDVEINYKIGDKVMCPFMPTGTENDKDEKALGTILQTRMLQPDNLKKYYIHFDGKDKRYDKWVVAETLGKMKEKSVEEAKEQAVSR